MISELIRRATALYMVKESYFKKKTLVDLDFSNKSKSYTVMEIMLIREHYYSRL